MNSTFTSRNKIALKVIVPCSSYLKENDFELILTRKIRKSASVQQIAIMRMMGSFRLFTIDPLGTISLEILMIKNLICHTSNPSMLNGISMKISEA